ncbi:MAG: hypothetical protein ACR2OW_08750 [Methyloligellaceae bacterium]
MTYVIVTSRDTIVGTPFANYGEALDFACGMFGNDAKSWIEFNLRIEENR